MFTLLDGAIQTTVVVHEELQSSDKATISTKNSQEVLLATLIVLDWAKTLAALATSTAQSKNTFFMMIEYLGDLKKRDSFQVPLFGIAIEMKKVNILGNVY